MNPTVKQSITNAIRSVIAAGVDAIQTKQKEEMLALREIIEKSLLLRDFFFSTLPPNLNATLKAHLAINSLPKVSIERWNQANLGYFDPYLDRVDSKGKIVSVGKDVYSTNIMFFV